jgi:hypothetical protein
MVSVVNRNIVMRRMKVHSREPATLRVSNKVVVNKESKYGCDKLGAFAPGVRRLCDYQKENSLLCGSHTLHAKGGLSHACLSVSLALCSMHDHEDSATGTLFVVWV